MRSCTLSIRHLSLACVLAFGPSLAGGMQAAAAEAAPEAAGLPTVTVTLKSGGILIGGLVERTPQRLVLRLTSTRNGRSMSADRILLANEFTQVSDLHDEYRARVAACGPNGQDHADLARWCIDNHLNEEAKTQARAALAKESVNADAVRLLHRLGQARVGGEWVDLDAWLAQQQLVRFDGLVCDAATRDRLRLLSATRLADGQALTDATATQRNQETQLASAKERLPKLQEQKSEVQKKAQESASLAGAVESAKKAVESAGQRVKSAEEARRKKQDVNTGKAVSDAQDAQAKAQKELKAAQQAAGSADPAVAKRRVEALEKDIAAAQADIKKIGDGQPAAAAAVVKAKAKAEASAAAYTEARKTVVVPANLPPDVVTALADQLQVQKP